MSTVQQIETTIDHSAEQIHRFVRRVESGYMLDRPGKSKDDRRSEERLNVTMPVRVTPLDNNFKPHGYQSHAVTRDVSSLGAGLVMSDPIAPNFVSLTLEPFYGEPFEVICKVAYCKDFGYYFRVGCEFLIPTQSSCPNQPATGW